MCINALDRQFYTEIGKIILKRRKDLKYSLQYVVDKLSKENKITKQTLSKYEKGRLRIDKDVFNELCKILEIDPVELLNNIHFE